MIVVPKQESVLNEKEQGKVKEIFEGVLEDKKSSITMTALPPEDQPVQITRPEFMRRMKEMQALQGMSMDGLPDTFNIVVNTNHPLIASKLVNMRSKEKKAELAEHLYNLALLNQNMLKGSDLTSFINKSIEFLK